MLLSLLILWVYWACLGRSCLGLRCKCCHFPQEMKMSEGLSELHVWNGSILWWPVEAGHELCPLSFPSSLPTPTLFKSWCSFRNPYFSKQYYHSFCCSLQKLRHSLKSHPWEILCKRGVWEYQPFLKADSLHFNQGEWHISSYALHILALGYPSDW